MKPKLRQELSDDNMAAALRAAQPLSKAFGRVNSPGVFQRPFGKVAGISGLIF